MRVGYARVSSHSQSLEIQLEALKDCDKVFSETETGTSTATRVQLEACLTYVREGDVLVVTRLDRMARSVLDLARIMDLLQQKDVGFQCIQQGGIDTTRPEGRLMLNILGAFAEFETAIRKERQIEGIAKARASGKYKGGLGHGPLVNVAALQKARREEGLDVNQLCRRFKIARATAYRHTKGMWGPMPRSLDRNSGPEVS